MDSAAADLALRTMDIDSVVSPHHPAEGTSLFAALRDQTPQGGGVGADCTGKKRAGEGTRTLDIQLGKLALTQDSHAISTGTTSTTPLNSQAGTAGNASPQLLDFRKPSKLATVCHTAALTYHLWKEVSCSQLKALRESPRAFYLRHVLRAAPPKSNDSLDFGSLFHTWAELGGEQFWAAVEICPDNLCTATGAMAKKAEVWLAGLAPGQIGISPADSDKLRAMTESLLRHDEVCRLIDATVDREFNVRFRWAGFDCRCRVDAATPDVFLDWKTTREPSPSVTFIRSVMDYGYHLQSAMYEQAQMAMGLRRERMRFITVRTVWPYECAVLVLPPALIALGRSECLRLLRERQDRIDWNDWDREPTSGVTELPCPAWALRKD